MIILLNNSPFATFEHSSTGYENEEDEPEVIVIEYYPESVEITGIWGESFDGEAEEELTYDNFGSGDFTDSMEDGAEEIDGKLSLFSLLITLLIIFMLANLKTEWNSSKVLSARTTTGVVLSLIGILSVITIFGLMSGISESTEIFFEEGEWDDSEEGVWGSVSSESETFDSEGNEITITSMVEWGPSTIFWLLIPFSLIALLGGAANLSYLKEDLEIEDGPVWFKNPNAPEFLTKHIGVIIFGILIAAVFASVFTQWYSIDQEWEVSRYESFSSNESNNTTHEISWTMSPFYVIYGNDTALELGTEGETTTSFDSYSEHHELTEISMVMLSLRWPLICSLILGLFYIARKTSTKVDEQIEGTPTGWTLLIMSSLILIYMFSTISSFEKEMTKHAEDDLEKLSPSWNIELNIGNVQNTFFGKTLSQDMIFGDDEIMDIDIHTEWGPSYGYFAALAVPWLIIAGISATHGPEFIRRLNEKEPVLDIEFDKNNWVARPAIAVLIGLLLTSSMGIGMGELIVDSESGAPPGLFEWDLMYDNTWTEDYQEEVMSDSQVLTFEYNTAELQLGNVTGMYMQIMCEEGDSGELSDQTDSISWTLEAPENTDTGETVMSGQIDCGDGPEWSDWSGEITVPDTHFAETKEEYLAMYKFINIGNGVWTFTITANVNEGTLPAGSDDSNLDMYCYISFDGIDGLDAVVEE